MIVYFITDKIVTGGVTTIITYLMDGLNKFSITAKCLTNYFNHREFDENRVIIIGFGLKGIKKFYTCLSLVFPRKVFKELKSNHKENKIIHLNSPYPTAVILALYLHIFYKIPIIYTVHANRSHMPWWAWYSERFVCSIADKIVFELKASYRDYAKVAFINSKTIFIPFGALQENIINKWINQFNDTVEFVTVARLEPNRYVDKLLDAFALAITNGNIKAKFKIIGDGILKDNLKRYANSILPSSSYIFVDAVEEGRIQDQICRSTCFITLSADGEVGMAGKIAAGVGMPCITLDLTGYSSYYSAVNIAELSDKMIAFTMLTNSDRARYANEVANTLYSSCENMVDRYLLLYKEHLGLE